MLYFTSIWRFSDAWPLAASMETEVMPAQDTWKQYSNALVKVLCRDFQRDMPRLLTVDHGAYCYHILCLDGILFLTCCQKSDPMAASYAFLEEISREFVNLYADQVERKDIRPYKFIKFDMFISKSRKVYQSPQGSATRTLPHVERKSYNQIMGVTEAPAARNDSSAVVFGLVGLGVLVI
eukprot:gene14767-22604_t